MANEGDFAFLTFSGHFALSRIHAVEREAAAMQIFAQNEE
jgi:hypothetical protein